MTGVSVIITAYNVERYIERAMQSALDQDGVEAEIIVVDDASTDRTWEIISRTKHPRLKLLRLPRNSGPGAARNTGIALATGTWIAVLDGDDAFEQGRLKRCLERAAEEKADMVVDNLTVCRESDGAEFPMFKRAFTRLRALDLADFISGNRSFLCGYALGYLKPVISADFLRGHKLAYDTKLRIGEDYLLVCELLASGATCAVEPTAGYRYTVRKDSISHRLSPEDAERIRAADALFLSRHTLPAAAAVAQERRERHLKEALAYTQCIDALKRHEPAAALAALFAYPLAVRNFWMPVWARMTRFFHG